MIIRKRILGLMLATACSLGITAAIAADYEPPVFEAPAEDEYVPVEVGSGWYLRGDVAYNFQRDFNESKRFADDFVVNDMLLGQIGPVDIFGFNEKESVVSGSLGMGYHFNDFLRAEVNIGTHGGEKYSASGRIWSGAGGAVWNTPAQTWATNTPQPEYGCLGARTTTTTEVTTEPDPLNPGQTTSSTDIQSGTDPMWRRDCALGAEASNKMFDGTANLYVDLGTFAGVTPYVGAGAGMLYSRNRASAFADCDDGTASSVTTTGGPLPNTTQVQTTVESTFTCAETEAHKFFEYDKATYNLMYSLSAGLAYQIAQNVSLDVGYTYKSAPNMEYYAVSATDIEKRKGYDIHQVKVGVRYDLW